jgi:hypothetical protein
MRDHRGLRPSFALPFATQFAHNNAMSDENQDIGIRGLWRWATKPPRIYVVYLIALILVWGLSFLAGTLNPKRTGSPMSPPPLSAPQR